MESSALLVISNLRHYPCFSVISPSAARSKLVISKGGNFATSSGILLRPSSLHFQSVNFFDHLQLNYGHRKHSLDLQWSQQNCIVDAIIVRSVDSSTSISAISRIKLCKIYLAKKLTKFFNFFHY